MKKMNLLIALLTILSAGAQVQIGGKAGIIIPDIRGNSEQSKGYTSRQDIYGGIMVNFQLTPYLSLQPEFNFSPQGGQRKGIQLVPAGAFSEVILPAGTSLYADFKTTTILNYLEIPVLLKLKLGDKVKYYLCGGPHIAFLLESKTKTSGNSLLYLDRAGTLPLLHNGEPLSPVTFDSNTDISESIKKVNAGVQGGLGVQYPLGRGHLFLEGRAILGLLNIQTHPEIDGKNKTGSLTCAIGYLLKIK